MPDLSGPNLEVHLAGLRPVPDVFHRQADASRRCLDYGTIRPHQLLDIPGYDALYAVLAFLGFAYAWRRSRSRPVTGSPVQPGDDESRSDLKRLASEAVVGAASTAAGFTAIVLGIVGIVVLRDGSIVALVFLLPAGILGVASILAGRRLRRGTTPR